MTHSHSSLCHLFHTSARLYFRLSSVGHFSLLPLFFQPGSFEAVVKSCLYLTGVLTTYSALQAATGLTLTLVDTCYFCGLALIWLFVEVIHPALIAPRLAFLPLLAVSVYCSIGTVEALVTTWKILGTGGVGKDDQTTTSSSSSGMTTRARSKQKVR